MTRFIHTSDWQLGMTRHFLAGEAQARFTEARLEAIGRIGRLAVDEQCAFVVVGGDVFETNQIERPIVVRALEAMSQTPSVNFYLLPGNHDPLDAASIFRTRAFADNRPDNVVVLDGEAEIEAASGVKIVGAPWPNKRPLVDLVNRAIDDSPIDSDLRIVVGHGAVDTLSPDPTDPARISLQGLETALAEGRAHYIALGDRHSTTDVGTSGRVRYSGAPEPTDYREDAPGNVLIVDLTADHVEVDQVSVGTWRFVREHFDVTGPEDCERVGAFLGDLPDKTRTIVKLSLVGQLSLQAMAALEATLDHAQDLFAALERWERRSDLVVLPDDDDFAALDLDGFALEALNDLRNMGESADESALVARDAMSLLYRLIGDRS